MAALYWTQTCVISSVSFERGTVSAPTIATAFAGNGLACWSCALSSDAELPPQALIEQRGGAECETGERHAETDGQMHGKAL